MVEGGGISRCPCSLRDIFTNLGSTQGTAQPGKQKGREKRCRGLRVDCKPKRHRLPEGGAE